MGNYWGGNRYYFDNMFIPVHPVVMASALLASQHQLCLDLVHCWLGHASEECTIAVMFPPSVHVHCVHLDHTKQLDTLVGEWILKVGRKCEPTLPYTWEYVRLLPVLLSSL